MRRRKRRHILLGEHLEEVLVAGIAARDRRCSVSRAPRTANGTPAWSRSCAMARTTLRLRSSKAPAQPTQYRTPRASGSGPWASPSTGTARPLAQSSPGAPRLRPRVARRLHVAERRVELLREAAVLQHQVAADLDDGVDVLDEHRAALHAPAAGRALPDRLLGDGVVDERQAQRLGGPLAGQVTGASPTPPLRRRRRRWRHAGLRPPRRAPSRPSTIWSRRPSMKCLGESVLPVMDAGQNSMHRPHSVHDIGSSRWRQVRSLRVLAPKTSSSPAGRLGLEVHLPQRAARARGCGNRRWAPA